MTATQDLPPFWRSALYVPVNQQRFVDKAHTRGADAVQLDLEDSIAPAEKDEARAMLPAAIDRVAGHDVDGVGPLAGGEALGVPGEHADAVPGGEQLGHEAPADVPGRPGDQDEGVGRHVPTCLSGVAAGRGDRPRPVSR